VRPNRSFERNLSIRRLQTRNRFIQIRELKNDA